MKTAAEIMINYLKDEEIFISAEEAIAATCKWNSRYPHLDSLSIAALAISDSPEIALTCNEIREITNFYFPPKNFIERSLNFI